MLFLRSPYYALLVVVFTLGASSSFASPIGYPSGGLSSRSIGDLSYNDYFQRACNGAGAEAAAERAQEIEYLEQQGHYAEADSRPKRVVSRTRLIRRGPRRAELIELTTRSETPKSALEEAQKRLNIISTNLANVDTPGYRKDKVDFRKELEKAKAKEHDKNDGTKKKD